MKLINTFIDSGLYHFSIGFTLLFFTLYTFDILIIDKMTFQKIFERLGMTYGTAIQKNFIVCLFRIFLYILILFEFPFIISSIVLTIVYWGSLSIKNFILLCGIATIVSSLVVAIIKKCEFEKGIQNG